MPTVTPTCDNNPTSYSINPDLPSGLIFSTVNGSIGGTPTAASARSLYKVTATNGGGSAELNIYLTVNPASLPTVSFTAPGSLTYDGTAKTYTAAATGPSGLALAYTGRNSTTYNSATAPTHVGDYTVTATSSDSNYSGSQTVDFAILARALTVTADAKTKKAGDADPVFTYQVTSGSLVGGDIFTGYLGRTSGDTAGTYAIQQGDLTAGSDYSINFVGANLTITPAGQNLSDWLSGAATNSANVGKYLIGGGTNVNAASERLGISMDAGNLVISAIIRTNDINYSSNQVVGQWVTNVAVYSNLSANSNVVFGSPSTNQTGVQTGFERRDFSAPRVVGTNTNNRLFLRLKATLTP